MRRLALLLLLAAPAAQGQDELEAALRSPAGDLAALHKATILEHGSLDPLLEELEELDTPASLRLAARSYRMRGDLPRALDIYEQLTLASNDAALWLAKAQLLDATGRAAQARTAYEQALSHADDDGLEGRIRLRIALLNKTGEDLAGFARRSGDTELRNRAAVVLALLGKPEEATQLFVLGGEGSRRFRGETRMAQWFLEARNASQAQELAWKALESARLSRDRRYALSLLVEAHRLDDTLEELVDRFAATPNLSDQARKVWIDLLRELGRVDEAMELFRAKSEGVFTVEMRRELLEMCRESGRDQLLVDTYRELVETEPQHLEWPEGLSRHFLERGRPEQAAAMWRAILQRTKDPVRVLAGARVLMGLGMDPLAIEFAGRAIESAETVYEGLLFLCSLHRSRGRMAEAERALQSLDEKAPPFHRSRMALAEALEMIGRKKRAAEVLLALRAARGPRKSEEDLDMRLAVLLSEVGDEDRAQQLWQELWVKVKSIPRRAYVEDRLLNVASRLGNLADIAIELEEKMAAGKATRQDSGLLVRLYTTAGDPVSAAEIIEEYVKRSGGDRTKGLLEKARVYLSCADFHNYERTLHELMRVDPEGQRDYLRQLAMSNLERAQPAEARKTLRRIKALEGGGDAAEFEAGVLALAGMYEEAMAAYRKGLVTFPDRIEASLLLGDLMARNGLKSRAVGMFQQLAETAARDDLFTVAIDGLLNVEAPRPVLEWARRITLERLAGRHDRVYLYQLLSDLSEELRDRKRMLHALESALPIAGERRGPLLRELMELAGTRTGPVRHVVIGGIAQPEPQGKDGKRLVYGRRLLHLDELVPPAVYLDLGTAFLAAGDVTAAAKTFARARDVPDYTAFQRRVAVAFEKAGYPHEALRVYGRLLIGESSDVDLIAKVGELQEATGRDGVAYGLYARAMDLMLSRRPFSAVKEEKKEDGTNRYYVWRSGNVEAFDQHYDRVLGGLLTTLQRAGLGGALEGQRKRIQKDLRRAVAKKPADAKRFRLRRYPRLLYRARFFRRVATAFGALDRADELDRVLLGTFPDDEGLLEELVKERLSWGFVASARKLIDASGRTDEQKRRSRFLAGGGTGTKVLPASVAPAEAARLFLPLLLEGRRKAAQDLLRRVHFAGVKEEDKEIAPLLVAVASYLDDPDSTLTFGRHWLTALVRHFKQGRLEGDVTRVLKECWVVLEPEHRDSLARTLVDVVVKHPKKASSLLRFIAQVQKALGTRLLALDQVRKLIREGGGTFFIYQPGPLLEAVSDVDRAEILREIWKKVPKSRRSYFVFGLLQGLSEPFNEEVTDFIVAKFDAGLKGINPQLHSYYIQNGLINNRNNPELALRLAGRLRAKDPSSLLYTATHAGALHTAGRKEEAREMAGKAYATYLGRKQPDNWVRSAMSRLVQLLGDDGVPALIAVIDEHEKKHGPSLHATNRRIEILQRRNDPDEMLEALRGAVRKHPGEIAFQDRLSRQYSMLGRLYDSALVLEKIVGKKPDNKMYRSRLINTWKRLRNPIRARLAAAEDEEKKEEAKEGDRRKVKPATIQGVKEAVDRTDLEDARSIWRRIWRAFLPERPRYAVIGPWQLQNLMRQSWPPDRPKPRENGKKKKPVRRSRGGLPDLDAEPGKPVKRKTALEALAELDFGEGELRRQLRSLRHADLDMAGPLYEALATASAQRMGPKKLLAELVASVRSGRAGKIEYALLLKTLENDEKPGEETRRLLGDLAATLNAYDTDQARRLARVYARIGSPEKAARLYRWCATQLNATSDYWRRANPSDLVDECCDNLEGELRSGVVDAILRSARPELRVGFVWDGDDAYTALVVRTWERVLGPEKALEKCRPVCEEAAGRPTPMKRATARAATLLFARAGEVGRAVRCLENALCRMDPSTLEGSSVPAHYLEYKLRPVYISLHDMRRLFPKETDGWTDAGAWRRAAADAVTGWLGQDRLQARTGLQLLTIIALRLHQAGDTERAAAALAVLKERAVDDPYTVLWVVDLARKTGDEKTAHAIERRLLDEKRLHVERVPEVVARVRRDEGAQAALDLGEAAAEYTLHPDLLAHLIEAARAAGKPDRAAHWIKVGQMLDAGRDRQEPGAG